MLFDCGEPVLWPLTIAASRAERSFKTKSCDQGSQKYKVRQVLASVRERELINGVKCRILGCLAPIKRSDYKRREKNPLHQIVGKRRSGALKIIPALSRWGILYCTNLVSSAPTNGPRTFSWFWRIRNFDCSRKCESVGGIPIRGAHSKGCEWCADQSRVNVTR